MGWTSRPTPVSAPATRSIPSRLRCGRRCCRRPEAIRRFAVTRTPSWTTSTKPCATSSPASSQPGTVAPSTCPTSPTAPRCGGCTWAFDSRPTRACDGVGTCSGDTPAPTARRGTTTGTSTPPGCSGRVGDRCSKLTGCCGPSASESAPPATSSKARPGHRGRSCTTRRSTPTRATTLGSCGPWSNGGCRLPPRSVDRLVPAGAASGRTRPAPRLAVPGGGPTRPRLSPAHPAVRAMLAAQG